MFSCTLKIPLVVERQAGENMRWKEMKWPLTDWRTWLNQQLKSMRPRLAAPSKNQWGKRAAGPDPSYLCVCPGTTQNSSYPMCTLLCPKWWCRLYLSSPLKTSWKSSLLSHINKDRPTVVTSNLKSQRINTTKVYFSLTQRPKWVFLFWQFSWVALFQAATRGTRLLPPWDASNFNLGWVCRAEESIGKACWVLTLVGLEVTLATSAYIPLACVCHLAPPRCEGSRNYEALAFIRALRFI